MVFRETSKEQQLRLYIASMGRKGENKKILHIEKYVVPLSKKIRDKEEEGNKLRLKFDFCQ